VGEGDIERQRFLTAVLQTVRSLVLVLDPEGRVVLFNRACEEVSGYTFEEMRGRCVWDVLLPAAAAGPLKQVFSQPGAGRSNEYENVWIAKDGGHRHISWTNTVLCDDQDRVQYVIPTGVDITEHRRAERRAEENEGLYRLLFERAHDSIYLCELPGPDGQGRILEANQPACLRLGYSREELLRTRVLDVHPPQVHEGCRRAEELLRKNGALIFETMERCHDGTLIPVEVSTHVLDLGGRQAVLTVSRDLSERRRLEQRLLEATRLDAIGRLAGGVAHDFNNLLVVILSGASAILDALPEGHPLREEAQYISDAGSRAALLTQQLLTYARRGVVKPVPHDLNAAVELLSKLLGRLLEERVVVELRLAPELGCVVVDPGRIQQVVMNLVVNARDAMPGGGVVTIETSNVDLPGETPAAAARPFVVLAVKDTGRGIAPEVRARLFEPFFTTKAEGRGTGLGLATARQIVDEAGGHIEVASKVGAGACFSVFLPRVPAPAPEAEAPLPPAAVTIAGLRVLVVEDETEVLRATCRMLEGAGCDVLPASDPLEALALVRKNPAAFDLLVTDVVMPRMNGKELADELHLIRPDLPIVFVSGYTNDRLGAVGHLDASLHFVEKPFKVGVLVAAVASARSEGRRR
jgi:two-component system, cell cycle sensor histidine kinase and response regulator CckA